MQISEHYNYTVAKDAEITWHICFFPVILRARSLSLCEIINF
jgi:hypothetical protein